MDVEDSKEPATSGANVQLVSRTVTELMKGGESKIDETRGFISNPRSLVPVPFQSMLPTLSRL